MTNPYPQQPYAPPAPPRRRKSQASLVGPWIVLGILAFGGAITAVAIAAGGKSPADRAPAPAVSAAVQQPSVDPSLAVPGVDAGAGTPGAPCATNRLGKYFDLNGVRYTCKGPKPYSWQP